MQSSINQAVTILRQGGLVAIPTETVYGLGADAKNPVALRKIFQAKQRPEDHPLIVHLADMSQLGEWVSAVPPLAQRLGEAFWPGPLTLILSKAPQVSDLITGGQETVGVRIPAHLVAHAVLKAFGRGIAAPSANRFGRISPTTATAVREELGDAVDWVLDGGQCEVGVESTIVNMCGEHPAILRPGMITAEQIEAVLQTRLYQPEKNAPRVSGSLAAHYAPMTPVKLMDKTEISAFLQNISVADLPIAILSQNLISVVQKGAECIVMPDDPKQYAHDLYATLRALDHKKYKQIIIEKVPVSLAWDAIRDRLKRASAS